MSERVVWVPFDPAGLGDLPDGLRVEQHDRPSLDDLPDSAGEVGFYVPPYSFAKASNSTELLAALPSLEVVQTLSAGVEHVRSHLPAGVTLCNARGVHDASTAELALALTLASLREVPRFVRDQDRGRWGEQHTPALADSRVLIVGYGSIGAAIEARLAPFEVEVVRVARSARDGVHRFEDLPDLVPGADVVVLVVPLTEETRGLVDADFLARMKDGALLVNVARGAVVDTDALVTALGDGRITAALDVTDPEPLPEGHPLWAAPGLLISPHVGGATPAMWPRAYRLIREQLARYAAGEPLANQMTGAY